MMDAFVSADVGDLASGAIVTEKTLLQQAVLHKDLI
jgi:hypothetical protein